MGFLRHIPTFFFLVATALLVLTTLSAPVFSNVALMKINLRASNSKTTAKTVNLGALGYCIVDNSTAKAECSSVALGYNVTAALDRANPSEGGYSPTTSQSLDRMTYIFVLHPVAAGLAFFAFLIAAFSDRLGFLVATWFASLAWTVTALIFIVDNIAFAVIKSHFISISSSEGVFDLSSYDFRNSELVWSLGLQCLAAALAALSIGSLFSICSCCSGGRKGFRKMKDEEKHVLLEDADPASDAVTYPPKPAKP